MNKYLLIKYDGNWADEIDVEGFWITTQDEHNEWKAAVVNHFKKEDSSGELIHYIGTNEEINYYSAKEVFNSLSEQEISEEEYKTIKKLFGTSYGFAGVADNVGY